MLNYWLGIIKQAQQTIPYEERINDPRYTLIWQEVFKLINHKPIGNFYLRAYKIAFVYKRWIKRGKK